MSSATINILETYNETLQILNTNPFHFITLSLLFLPLTVVAAATLFFTTTVLLIIIFTFFFTILPTVVATALITYSTSLTINNTSSSVITFKSTLDSLRHSFLPLLSTFLAAALQLAIIYLFFTNFINVLPVLLFIIKTMSFHDQHPTISYTITTLYSFVSKLMILYLVSVWGSSASISVLESKSGFDALRESQSRWANNTSFSFRFSSFVAVSVTGIMIRSVVHFCTTVVVATDVKLETTKWHLYVQACAYLLALCLVLLQYVVMNTVLYFEAEHRGDQKSPKMESVTTTTGGCGFSSFFIFLGMIGFVRVSIGLFVNRH